MRLKEIKPGMAIRCKNYEEKKALLEEAERLGYIWCGNMQKPTQKSIGSTGNTIHFNDADKSFLSAGHMNITHSTQIGGNVIEFSDLILPELTVEEVLSTISEMCRNKPCKECYLGAYCDHMNSACSLNSMEPKVIIDVCIKWKQEHKKKEPEIETVDICRIIEIQPNGKKRCVHEEDINPDPELPYGSEEIAVHEILKRYCIEHDGEFIAVHEVVSRVKR